MALGQLGQRIRSDGLGDRVGRVLVVCLELWQLQQNIWFARRGYRLHDLDLDFHHHHPGRRRI